MLVVIDTNILVGACMGTKAPRTVIERCLSGDVIPLMSIALYAEYEDVLNRDTPFSTGHLNRKERLELMDIFMATTQYAKVYFNWRPNLKDEGDNHLIELAIAGGSQAIVTRNIRDFKNPELLFPDLRIYTPEDFLEVMK
ncbi:MAG: putative toxin-antitoxin system toxin component, PIN family [Thiolinea sp.]